MAADRRKLFKRTDPAWVGIWASTWLICKMLPPWLVLRLVRLKGWIFYHRRAESRRKLLSTLADAYAPMSRPRIEKLAKESIQFEETVPAVRLLFYLHRMPRYSVSGEEHLQAATASKRGAILLTSHFGYGRSIRSVVDSMGYSTRILGHARAGRERWPGYTRFGLWAYGLFSGKHPMQNDNELESSLNLRPIFEALDRNEIVLTTADGLGTVRVVIAELLGRPAPFNGGIFSLAAGKRTPLLPAFLVPGTDGADLKLIIEPPMEISGKPEEDAATFARLLERYIHAYPELYQIYDFDQQFRYGAESIEDRYRGVIKQPRDAS